MLIFDIGANIGRYSISNYNNGINKLIAVEASPTTFIKLKENVALYNNIIPLNYAVTSDLSEFITFYQCNSADTLSTLDKNWLCSPDSRFYNYRDSIEEIKVKTTSIDNLIELYGEPDMIKVDVEGAEYNVIKSLTKKVKVLSFEWASEWKHDIFNTLDHLFSLGFTKFHIQIQDNYTYMPDSYNLSVEDVKLRIDMTTPKHDWGMIWAI